MRNFDLIASGLDVVPLLDAIESEPARWYDITLRQRHPGSAHHDTETIFIRGPKLALDLFNEIESIDYAPADSAIQIEALRLIEGLPLRIAELGRVMVVSLKAGGYIDAHTDEGDYAANFSRFHIAIHAEKGNVFHVGQESAHIRTGDCWWFNHRLEHEVANLSPDDRIHLIFDARVSSLYQKKEA